MDYKANKKLLTQYGKQIMKINNENETYTLHFIFLYKYSTYQIFMNTCNGKQYQHNISTYEKTRYMI